MKRIITRIFPTCICMLIGANSFADSRKFTTELADSLTRVDVTVRVPVWIELQRLSDLATLKSTADAPGLTRIERYQSVLTRIRNDNESSQRDLSRYMSRMASADEAKIRTHWLVNVIEAELTPDELETISDRPDVVTVHLAPKIVSIEPEVEQIGTGSASAISSNLTYINANDAWQAGYTGAGRVICSFDNGVSGTHRAIRNSWKGKDGDSAAAWFDPVYRQKAPHTISGQSHGTHVVGILCGHDDATGDTIGVALNAKWISAAVIDIPGASIIDAFEWAADPDGDPNTIGDVPDVINHSWGAFGVGCADLFYDLIDYTEALGIVNVFAAGNDGPANTSIRNPGNRANDSLDCFAAGNLNHSTGAITTNSGRGPSNCNLGARKPNVVAPGTSIRSAFATTDSLYGNMSGTSMATPHVAGLVALLRQKNPNATVTQIKNAILNTTRTDATIVPGNTYGWGEIDCMAALNAFAAPSTPGLKIQNFAHGSTSRGGGVVSGIVTLVNGGTTANGVNLTITGSNPSLTVLSGIASFGTIAGGTSKASADSLRLQVSDTVTEGSLLPIQVTIAATGGYSVVRQLYIQVGQPLERSHVTHNSGLIQFTVSNFGTYGLAPASFYPLNGAGFIYRGNGNDQYESGILISDQSGNVSDGVRNLAGEWDGDFRVLPGGNITLNEPGVHAEQESFTRMSDDRSENPIGIELTQESFSFTGSSDHDFIILRFILKNEKSTPLTGLRFGLYSDWDLPSNGYTTNAGGWDFVNKYLWAASYPFSDTIKLMPRAMVVLQGDIATGHTGPGSDVSLSSGGFTEVEKAQKMQTGFSTASLYADSRNDLYQIMVAGPINLPANGLDTVAFAIVAADSMAFLTAAVDHARAAYSEMIGNCCIGIRGNVDADGNEKLNILDVIYLVARLYADWPPPECSAEANVDGDANGSVNIVDLNYLLNYLFLNGPAPAACP